MERSAWETSLKRYSSMQMEIRPFEMLFSTLAEVSGLTFDIWERGVLGYSTRAHNLQPELSREIGRFSALISEAKAFSTLTAADGHIMSGVPFRSDDESSGILIAHDHNNGQTSLFRNTPETYPIKMKKFLTCLAGIMEERRNSESESVKMVEDLTQQLEDLYLYSRISSQVKPLTFSGDMLKELIEELLESMRVDLAFSFFPEREEYNCISCKEALSLQNLWPQAFAKASISLIPENASSLRDNYFVVNDSRLIPEYQRLHPDPFRFLAAMVRDDQMFFGWVGLVSFNMKEVFRQGELHLLKSLAKSTAVALENARLYRESLQMSARLERKYKEIDLLYEFEQHLSGIYNLSELFQNLLKGTIKYLKCEAAALIYPENNQTQLLIIHKDRGVEKSTFVPPDLEFLETLPLDDPQFDKNSLLRQINEKTGNHFDFLKIIPLQSNQEKFRPAVILIRPLTQGTSYSELENSQVLDIIGQKVGRAIELLSLRVKLSRQDRLSSLGQMMGTIVHDLRNPIGNIENFSDFLTRGDTSPEDRQEFFKFIQLEIKSIMNMITEILDFSKGKTSILPRKACAADVLERFQPQIEQLFRNSGISLKIENSSEKLIHADIEKLTRVFYNISKNAVEALKGHGNFSFKIYDAEKEVIFELKDDGPGIPDEIRGRLFDSFVTSGKESGTGLGLAIVKKIIDEHHGKIDILTARGQGTVVLIKLPEFKREV